MTFRNRWPAYLTVVLLVGLLGGLSMGAIAGARRTESSFPKYLASTHPSDLLVLRNDSETDANTGDPAFLRRLAHLPHVARVESATSPTQQLLAPDGSVAHDATHELFDSTVQMTADVNGEFFDQDRPSVLEGRMLDPQRADEMVLSVGAAGVLHAHVGAVIPFAFYTNKQTNSPDYGTGKQTPVRRIGIKLVGIVIFHSEIIRDDIDSTLRIGLFSPALTRSLATCCSNGPIAGVRLDHGSRDDAAVASEVNALPNTHVIQITAVQQATAERAVKPQSFALGVFGVIAALATLLIAGQVIGRQLRNGTRDLDTLRALGANPAMTVTDGLIGVVGAIVGGAVLAALIAVALSPLSPLGPVRPVYPGRGIAFDWTVIGAGVALLVVLLTALAAFFAYRRRAPPRRETGAPHRSSTFARRGSGRRVRVAGIGRYRHSTGARSGSRHARRPLAFGHLGRGARNRRRRRHGRVRREPQHARLASRALRVELELRDDRQLRRPRRRAAPASGKTARPRPERRGVVASVVRRPADRRSRCARARDIPERQGWAAGAVGPRARRRRIRSFSARRPSPSCTSTSAPRSSSTTA